MDQQDTHIWRVEMTYLGLWVATLVRLGARKVSQVNATTKSMTTYRRMYVRHYQTLCTCAYVRHVFCFLSIFFPVLFLRGLILIAVAHCVICYILQLKATTVREEGKNMGV
jgi:hypothetical protein